MADRDELQWQAVRERFAVAALRAGAVDVAFERHETPWGDVLVAATEIGVVRVGLPAEDADQVLNALAAKLSPRVLRAPRSIITQARTELDQYAHGGRTSFSVPLDLSLANGFRRAVLAATAQIPYAATASYGEVATIAGSPRAVRAAGTALATNPLPILLPCHRVVRANGELGQYLGGVAMKRDLLQLEAKATKQQAPTS